MSRSSSGSASPIEAASQPRRVDKDEDEDDEEEEDETITQLVIGGTTKRLTVNGGELDQIDENQIVTLNESVSLISRDVLNNEIQSSLIDELDTKYVIVRHSNAATKTRNDEISEEALIDKSIMEMRRQLVSSSSWPSMMLTSSKPTKDESITKKQNDEYSTIGKSTSTAINEDKSYQVNAVDLPGAMVDTHTQMTPPLSPKTSEEAKKKMMSRSSSMKKSVATETDELSDEGLFSEKMISSEERRLRKKLLEKENELRSVSIATQTLFESTDEGLAATASELSWTRVEQEVFYSIIVFLSYKMILNY
jgi:hypothetical protein